MDKLFHVYSMGDLEISFSKVIALYVVTKAFTVTVDLLKLMPSIFSEVFEVCFTKNFIESVIDWQWQVANVWLIWYVAQWCWSVEWPLFGERAYMVPDDTKEDKPLSLLLCTLKNLNVPQLQAAGFS